MHFPDRGKLKARGRGIFLVLIMACLRLPTAELGAAIQDESRFGEVAVGQNADGRLEIFRVDNAGELRHRWQKEIEGDWSPSVTLGGWICPNIAVASEADGRLEVFAVDNSSRKIRYKWQWSPNHPDWDWSSWTTLGGGGTFRPPVVVGRKLDGCLEVFAIDAVKNNVRHIWETNVNGGWSGWADLGGNLEPGLVMGKNKDGRLELFGVDANTKDLRHCWQGMPNDNNNWSAWNSLGGNLLPELALGQNADGRLEIFGVNRQSGAVGHIYQSGTNSASEWSPWAELGGKVKAGIVVGQRANGSLEIFAVNSGDATLLHSHETNPGDSGSWSQWQSAGGSVRPSLAVGRHADGNLEVFAVASENADTLNHRRQISDNNGWLEWLSMDHPSYQYASRSWQMGDGLPHDQVQALAQTPDGYLWVGTRGGLARFDGINFTVFDEKNTPELKSNSIRALAVDRHGSLWIGIEGGGVVCLQAGVFTRYSRSNGLAGDHITAICNGKKDAIWIGTTTGLSRYQNGTFANYTQKEGLLADGVRSLFEDDAGTLWIATSKGLNCLKMGVMNSFTRSNGLPEDSVTSIYQARGGRLWIGSDAGVAWYNEGSFYPYSTRHGLSDRFVNTICDDQQGNLWVGTHSGLNRFLEGRFANELNHEGLPYDRVNALFEDREHNLWVGSTEGLIRLTRKRFFAYTKRQGLSHNNIMSVLEDHNGTLWMGTQGGGLNFMRGERCSFFGLTNGLRTDLIWATCESRDDSLWIGAAGEGGLSRFGFKTRQFTHYTWKDGLIRAPIKVLREDVSGNLWIGTSLGLSCWKDGKFKNYTVQDGLGGESVNAMCEDAAGKMWFGTGGGLSRWEAGRFSNFNTSSGLSDNAVLALYEDKKKNLWIGTAQGGLNRYKDGQFKVYTTHDGLFSDEIFEILEDDYGWLWMSCSRGVFRVRKEDLDAFDRDQTHLIVSIAYGKADGMESTQCNGQAKPGAWKARDGKLWFPTTKGLVGVDPNIEIQNTPPPVFVQHLIADGKWVASGRLGMRTSIKTATGQAEPAHPDSELRVPPGRGELEFHYAALNFQTPEKTRYKYRLDGVDLDWVDADGRRVAHYNNIYPGSYRFQVIACNSDGIWNETGASLTVLLRPHFWQTWWFYTVAALSCIGMVGGVARSITKTKMQRKLEQLKQQHEIERERGRIARDIHDELGSSLTRIMLLGQRTQEDVGNPEQLAVHAGRIVTSARATVQSLDEIVWAVDPKKDTLDGLVGYITQYVNQFFEGAPMRCRLEMPVNVSALTLPSEVRHDLFLAVKEALNNVMKHSQASEVRVRLTEAAAQVTISIEDNGRGFDSDQAGSGRRGNGLENMRKRMANLNGDFCLMTTPGQGTLVKFTVRVV